MIDEEMEKVRWVRVVGVKGGCDLTPSYWMAGGRGFWGRRRRRVWRIRL